MLAESTAPVLGFLFVAGLFLFVRLYNAAHGMDRFTCPFCKHSVRYGATACAKCGHDLPPLVPK